MRFKQRHLIAAIVAALSLNAHAETDPVAVTLTATTTAATTPVASSRDQSARLATQYATWAGSTENAQSLVTGLRTSTPITLQSTSPTPGLTETVTFTPPTQNMGWGNVTKALSLAQADLAAAGITNPTPQQLQIALTGGDITTLQGTTTHMDGVLTMRSQGMGWGQIAHKLDLQPGATFKPASVETRAAGLRSAPERHLETQHAGTDLQEAHHAVTASGTAVAGSGRVTTAAGKLDQENHASHGSRETRHNALHTYHAPINRIVTASGAPIASHATFSHTEHGGGHVEVQQVSHITSASGSSMGASGGHGSSNGNAFGHGKN